MSLKYLNFTGLSNLVTNIKNWVIARIPTKTSEITNDSGFITGTSDCVHKAGAETVTGEKNHTANFNLTKSAPLIRLRNTDVVIGSNGQQDLTASKNTTIAFKASIDSYANAELTNYAMGTYNRFRIISRWYTSTSAGNGIGIDLYTDANIKGLLPTENNKFNFGSASYLWKAVYANAYYLGTTAFGDIVTHNASEFASDDHTHSYLPLSGGTLTGNLIFKKSGATRGTAPSYNVTFQHCDVKDSANNRITLLETTYYTDMSSKIALFAYKTTAATGSNIGSIGIGCTASGTVYTFAPTPAASDNSTQIATTAWVNGKGYLTSHQSLSNYSTKANTVKSLSISGKTITVTPGSGDAYTLTTQDTVYTHPTTAGNKHIPSGGAANQYLKYSASGTAVWANLPTIPTKTSELTNDSGFLTSHQSLSNYVTLNGTQTISGGKTFSKSFGDGDPSILIQSSTAYANGTWNYPLAALAPNMKAGANLFMPIGRNFAAGNCAGWHWCYAGNNSNDNYVSVEFYAVGSHFAVYRDGRVFLSTTPATSDNSTRVATTAFVKANAYTHPTSAGNKHIPSGGSSGQILKYSSSGTAVWANADFARKFATIHSESGTGYAYARTSWTPKEVSLTLTTQQPAFISIDITTSGTMLFKGSASNCFVIAVHNSVGSQANKQDSTTYGTLFTQTSSGRNRVQVLIWPYSSSVKISIAYISGTSNIINGDGLDSFSMGVYQ